MRRFSHLVHVKKYVKKTVVMKRGGFFGPPAVIVGIFVGITAHSMSDASNECGKSCSTESWRKG